MEDKYIRAGALAEQFRDMAEFADGVQAVALREAADAVDNMPGEDVRPFRAGEWQLVVGYARYLRCPFCGFETRNSTQPINEGWKCCPGCGNKCSGGGNDGPEQEEIQGEQKGGVPDRGEE